MPKTYEICFKYRNWNRDQSTFDKWWWSLSVFHVFLVSLAVQMFEIYSQNHRPAAPNLDAKTFKTSVSEKEASYCETYENEFENPVLNWRHLSPLKCQAQNWHDMYVLILIDSFPIIYRKVASSNTSRLEPHPGFYRLLMKGIFDAYVLWPFWKQIFLICNTH